MRDNYKKSLRKNIYKGKYRRKYSYKYSKFLSFLDEFFIHRQAAKCPKKIKQEAAQELLQNQDTEQSCESDPLLLTAEERHQKMLKLRKKADTTNTDATEKLIGYIMSREQKESCTTQHPVDAFLAGIAPTLKDLTPYYQNLSKSEIFAVVQKYEMKMFMDQHTNQGQSNLMVDEVTTVITEVAPHDLSGL